MKASDLISALCKVLDVSTQNALAERLGISVQTLLNWKKQNGELTPSQVANLLAKSRLSAVWVSQYETILPLVEYFKVRRVRT